MGKERLIVIGGDAAGMNKESRLDLLQSGSNLKWNMRGQEKVNWSHFGNYLNEAKGEST